jgi:hypothetical protein
MLVLVYIDEDGHFQAYTLGEDRYKLWRALFASSCDCYFSELRVDEDLPDYTYPDFRKLSMSTLLEVLGMYCSRGHCEIVKATIDEYKECPYCHGHSSTCEDCGGNGFIHVEV